ncbi:hypothetical protein [Gellertiella hungarica]|uniref:TnsA endonuclease N-terminal domain-containing protein n=1 Tax=Gellertiella hungarica TaxID=1572859 RepID=A0A7W6NN95_9HYPH|nr:hypothetical protein [Gellertiella hungarica]MBB4067240.1 hypothetical protein [Gellertiella hungarica]
MRSTDTDKIEWGAHARSPAAEEIDWRLQPGEAETCRAEPPVGRHAVARMYWAEHGGPIRTIIDGRKTRPTGTFRSMKGGGRSMPWDSKHERTAMRLADLSSRVQFLLAQPHRLEILVRGNGGRPLIYFPDLLLKVHPSFLHDLQSGMPYAEAALMPCAANIRPHHLKTLIVEVKADADSRDTDPKYARKLELAKEVYSRRGFSFVTVRESQHLPKRPSLVARYADLHKFVVLDARDYQSCLTCFGGRHTQTEEALIAALGGGPSGYARLIALHYRRFVSIEFSAQRGGGTVHLVAGAEP